MQLDDVNAILTKQAAEKAARELAAKEAEQLRKAKETKDKAKRDAELGDIDGNIKAAGKRV